MIPGLVKESVGIRGIGRILKISVTTVVKKIKAISSNIIKPLIPLNRQARKATESVFGKIAELSKSSAILPNF